MTEQEPKGSVVRLKLTRKQKARIAEHIKAMNWPWVWDSKDRVWRLIRAVER